MEAIERELAECKAKLLQINNDIQQLNDRKNEVLDKIEYLNEKVQVQKSKELAQKDWTTSDFPWSSKLLEALFNIFKLSSFRPLQLSTINSILSGQDVILIMPTGGGKSLCYQLPAVISKGLTLVISPLISLMEDQLSSLRKLNVECHLLSSTTSKSQNSFILKEISKKDTNIRLLYVTPERLAKSKRFMAALQKCYIHKSLDRIAIDEVHCCSNWGHDFRPDYKFLNILKTTFAGVPIMGLTATATRKVTADVQKMLNMQGCLILKASFNRPNLFYQVIEKPSKSDDCMDLIAKLLKQRYANQSGIIYTTTIKDTENIRDELKKRGLKVGCYHANMEPKDRSKTYEYWMDHTYQAVVATIAFGLGIDKPDVRFVIHHALSKSMENFYQESGRAGRDGKRSECLVLYKLTDTFKLSPMVFSTKTGLTNLYGMLEYCIDTQRCRRTIIADHFDEMWESSHCIKMCDYCARISRPERTRDLKHYFDAINKILQAFETPMTVTMLIDSWLHKGALKYRLKDLQPPSFSREEAESVIAWMLVKGLLSEQFHFTPYNTISYIEIGNKDFVGFIDSYKIVYVELSATEAEVILSENKEILVPLTQFPRFQCDIPAPCDLDNQISNDIVTIEANSSKSVGNFSGSSGSIAPSRDIKNNHDSSKLKHETKKKSQNQNSEKRRRESSDSVKSTNYNKKEDMKKSNSSITSKNLNRSSDSQGSSKKIKLENVKSEINADDVITLSP